MKHEEFFLELKAKKVRPAYLLHGDEEYVKERAIEQLIGILEAAVSDFNSTRLVNPEVDDLLANAQQLPLMDDRRLVFVLESRFLNEGQGEVKRLIEYLASPNPTTTLVFVCKGKADSRRSLFKAIAKDGGEVLFDTLSDGECVKWIMQRGMQLGMKIQSMQAQKLSMMVGSELFKLNGELLKLSAYANGRPVTNQIMEECVCCNLDYTVFAMLEDFLSGRMALGMAALHSTLKNQGSGASIKLLSFLSGRLRLMLKASRALDKGASSAAAAKLLEGNPYAAKKAVEAAKKFSTYELENALLELADIDYGLKSGGVREENALELVMIRIFSHACAVKTEGQYGAKAKGEH